MNKGTFLIIYKKLGYQLKHIKTIDYQQNNWILYTGDMGAPNSGKTSMSPNECNLFQALQN